MPQMQFPKIVAFVEGDMEQLFINKNFKYVEVVSVSNGDSWSTSAMANQISTFYQARSYYGWWVVVWIDREKRTESALDIEETIREALVNAGASSEQIKILIADQMSENIILADTKFIKAEFGLEEYQYVHAGRGGKRHLSDMYRNCDINYRETKHGVAALKKIRLFRSAEQCASTARFLATNNIDCWWFDQDNQPSSSLVNLT